MVRFILIYFFLVSCAGGTSTHAERAEQFIEAKEYGKARVSYAKHMEKRLASKRPSSENPYFYLVKIGDAYLLEDRLKEAEKIYATAIKREVQPQLLGTRFRELAEIYFTKREDHKSAFRILKTYRYLDDLLFDSLLDEFQKESLRQATQPKRAD